MRKLKPNYNPETIQGELVEKVCEYFGRVYDDFEEERHLALRGRRTGDPKWEELMKGDPTINEVAKEFSMSTAKIRKILITGGCYIQVKPKAYKGIQDLIKCVILLAKKILR